MHLANAGLVDGSFEGYQGEASGTTASVASINARYLKSKYGGYIFPTIFTNVAGACSSGGDYTAYTREAGNSFSIADYQIGIPYFPRVIPTDDVRRMDEKIDDRLPLSGNVGTGSNSTPMINNLQLLGAAVACNQATYALTVGTCDKLKIVFANRF